MEHPENAATLMRAGLFEGLDPRVVDHVAGIVEQRSIPPGQHVFFEGDIATEFYVVSSGSMRVYIPSRGEELNAAIVRDGRTFGEGGMFDGGQRVASALAWSPRRSGRPQGPMAHALGERTRPRAPVFSTFGAALRRYVVHMLEFLFLEVDVPDAPPPQGEGWPDSG